MWPRTCIDVKRQGTGPERDERAADAARSWRERGGDQLRLCADLLPLVPRSTSISGALALISYRSFLAVRRSADAELRGACGPGAPALAGLDLLRDVDLLLAGGLVGDRGVLAAAEGEPGRLGELQAAGEAVAGVDRPVSAGLALGEAVPHAAGRGGGGGGAGVAGLRGLLLGGLGGLALGAAVRLGVGLALLGLRSLLDGGSGLLLLDHGLGLGLGGGLGALGDDLGDGLGDDLLRDELGLGDLAVHDRVGVDLLGRAGLALGGGLRGALDEGVVLDGLRLEGDLLGLLALLLADAVDLVGRAV